MCAYIRSVVSWALVSRVRHVSNIKYNKNSYISNKITLCGDQTLRNTVHMYIYRIYECSNTRAIRARDPHTSTFICGIIYL